MEHESDILDVEFGSEGEGAITPRWACEMCVADFGKKKKKCCKKYKKKGKHCKSCPKV